MSTTATVTIPGSTLFERAAQFAKKLLAGPAAGDGDGDLWQLYRMTRGVDSVRPGVTRKLDLMARRRANQAG